MSLGRRVTKLEADVFMCLAHGVPEPRLCPDCDILDCDLLTPAMEAACQALVDTLPDCLPYVGPRYACPTCGELLICLSCSADFTGSRLDTPAQKATREAMFALIELCLRSSFVAKLRGEA